jgi:phosphatidyl-myo-inositol dimannoside synthase
MNRICYFSLATFSKTGGIESFNKTFLKALNGYATAVTSVSVYDEHHRSDLKNIEFKNFNANKIKASLYILKNIYKIDQLILAHLNLLPVAIVAKAMNPSLRIYLSIYGIEVWTKLPMLYRLFLKYVKVFSISNYTTKEFTRLNRISPENIFYLPPDTGVDVIAPSSESVYLASEFNVLTVSRLAKANSYKGIDSMIKAIPVILKSVPNFKYTVIGKGDDKDRLMSLAKKIGVDQHVDFKGFVEYIEPYYEHCDVFALPCQREGFGIVYLEAMKYRKPCIACDTGGQTDVVIHNETGFLCKYDDIERLSERVVELCLDKDIVLELGENGYNHLLTNFTFIKFKERLALYLT